MPAAQVASCSVAIEPAFASLLVLSSHLPSIPNRLSVLHLLHKQALIFLNAFGDVHVRIRFPAIARAPTGAENVQDGESRGGSEQQLTSSPSN